MTDLSSYLRPSANSTLPPPLLPAATYLGIISGTDVTPPNQNGTVFLRVQLAIDTRGESKGWPDVIPEEAKIQHAPNGELIPIKLELVRLRKDFALTPAAYYRLDNFLIAMGFSIETDSEGNKDYEPAVNDLKGRSVKIEVQMIRSRTTGELITVVNDIYPRNTR